MSAPELLLTSHGLRSLAPGEPGYMAVTEAAPAIAMPPIIRERLGLAAWSFALAHYRVYKPDSGNALSRATRVPYLRAWPRNPRQKSSMATGRTLLVAA